MPGRGSAHSDAYDPATILTMLIVPEVHRKSCAPAGRGSIRTRSTPGQAQRREQQARADEGVDYRTNKACSQVDPH